MVQELRMEKAGKYLIGVTGSMGSGKSTVARMFEEEGATVIDADRLAHEALLSGSAVYSQIVNLLGQAYLDLRGFFDRKKIAQLVFKEAAKRKALEAIIHPYVFSRMQEEISKAKNEVVVLDVPLLFETGLDRFCNRTVAVGATDMNIEKRLRSRGFKAQEIELRTQNQMPLAEKIKRADDALCNDGSLEETRKQVSDIWEKVVLRKK